MKRKFEFAAPVLQADFAFILNRFRGLYLQEALFETVRKMSIIEVDKQLACYAQDKDLSLMAQFGFRGEILFAVPVILKQNPYLLGYYRLVRGYSQKEFYSGDNLFGATAFRSMVTFGLIAKSVEAYIPDLCRAFCKAASLLLHKIKPLKPDKEIFNDLALLTVGPQLRGGANNRRGDAGTKQLFKLLLEIVNSADPGISDASIEFNNAAGRKVIIEFAEDPDVSIREEMAPGIFRNIVAIEIKSGTDRSNIHNRIGEAEKSHQKARQDGFTECWTITNVKRLAIAKAKSESPSTNRFYSLNSLLKGGGRRI